MDDFPIPPLRNQQVVSHQTNAEFTALCDLSTKYLLVQAQH